MWKGYGALAAALVLSLAACNSEPQTPLNAVVQYSGAAIRIHNKDSYSWADCDLDLNSDYSIKGAQIAAGDSSDFSSVSFVKKDGTRFNPITTKPMTLFIYCRGTQFGTRSTMVGWK